MESIPTHKTPILVVDDDAGLLLSIEATLVSSGVPEPALVSDSRRVMELIRKHRFHLVLLDLIMPYMGGLELLKQVKEEFPDIECIIVTAIDEASTAVQAIKLGAFDYLVKPIDKDKMIIVINNALERYSLRHGLAPIEKSRPFSELKTRSAFKHMVAEDENMARVFHQAETAAASDYNLIITGETGTGKGMLAKIIHRLSHRSNGPFVPVNISASSKALFEDDFFGHTKGAYTGALAEKKGFFEAAQEGTLFLDEIAELEPELQVKLLQVIEDKQVYRLGSTELRKIDVRIIAATNRDIKKEIINHRFREDLFFRLNMFHIHIPPLRKRKKDIIPMARHFLSVYAQKNQKNIDSLDLDLIDRLMNYPFPGNVRELENIIASAVLLENGKKLTSLWAQNFKEFPEPDRKQTHKILSLAEIEKRHIYLALEATGGNRTQAAKILGIGLRTLRRKLNKNNDSETRPI
jgi:DNA-binding NtrC family response regulator